uniref:Condensin complex subunit 1 C-terminal domain-containing protein n=1 Tax=Chaetoceros debilis TaxID=122233 RepID=A0A7S3VCC6_9STRA
MSQSQSQSQSQSSSSLSSTPKSTFPIPSTLSDLESHPYDLLPYPIDFADDDEATRASSFLQLVQFVEDGNAELASGMRRHDMSMFENNGAGDHNDDRNGNRDQEGMLMSMSMWCNEERLQALYTLVRKSASLSFKTRSRLIAALCNSVSSLGIVLQNAAENDIIVGTGYRDALSAHLYMLYTIMVFTESHIKGNKQLNSGGGNAAGGAGAGAGAGGVSATPAKKKRNGARVELNEAQTTQVSRELCTHTMNAITEIISNAAISSHLWRSSRGVPSTDVIMLPARIAYTILESCTNVTQTKMASGKMALDMLANILFGYGRGKSGEGVKNTVVTALVDMLHNYEHMSALVAELCLLSSGKHPPSDSEKFHLAVELLREVSRLDMSSSGDSKNPAAAASGVKNVAPFLMEVSRRLPRMVLSHAEYLLKHLNSEPYQLRSSIVQSIGFILVSEDVEEEELEENDDEEFHTDETVSPSKGRTSSKKLNKSREHLYSILLEHVYDVSSYTRVAVLKTWATILDAGVLPLDNLVPLTQLAIDRLQDKTVMVRRSAMQILTMVLENNPFTDSLSPIPYEHKRNGVRSYILEHMPTHLKDAMQDAIGDLRGNDSGRVEDERIAREELEIEDAAIQATISESASKVVNRYSLSPEAKEDSDTDNKDEDNVQIITPELIKQCKIYTFLTSALEFINLFECPRHIQAFESMLLSNNKSDVTEALRFFVRARHFDLPCAITGMKQALALMWSEEESVKNEVLNAFIQVFICGTSGSSGSGPGSIVNLEAAKDMKPLPSKTIVDNLIRLVGRSNVSEQASIEEAISRLVKMEVIPSEVFLILWSIAAKAPGRPRSIAMTILSMGATADAGIVDSASRLRHLLQAGLGEYTEEHRDWATAKSAAYALQRVSRVRDDPSSAKFLVLEQIVERLCVVIQGDWCNDDASADDGESTNENDTKQWFGAAEEAINAIFCICPAPEKIARVIIKNLEGSTFGFGFGNTVTSCHSLRLSRFFFVISHISLKLLVYTEALSASVRNANAARTLAKQEDADKAKSKRNSGDENSTNSSDDDDDDIEAELGMAQAAEAETENMVAEIAEKEIVGRGLIGLFTPLLVRIVANDNGQGQELSSSEVLMQSSVLALCKFMCISRGFCEKHLPLLFTALAQAPKREVTLRANTVIALGDLAFRFPNELEPYTPRLYACLRDESTRVRLHTLMCLVHLILNSMVKVKGNLAEICLCLRDKESRIRDMARLLFHELSKRSNNPIYNLLPEIWSQLNSMPASSLKKDDFRYIMTFLLSFIKKERQIEMLTDKLCKRFPKCTSIAQKGNLSYCLAQLKYNDKSIKVLNDHFKLYKDSLFDEEVFKCFGQIVQKTRKFAKPETKQILEELEEKLADENKMGMENDEANKKAAKAKSKATTRRAAISRRRKVVEEEVSSESEVEESEESDSESDDNSDGEDTELNKENSSSASKYSTSEGKVKGSRISRRSTRSILKSSN